MSALSLVSIVPPREAALDAERAKGARVAAAVEANNAPVLQGLAKHVADCFADARTARQSVLPRLQRARLARDGEYSPTKLAEIRKFGGSEVYLRVIANKCMILLALLKDVYLGQTDKPWSLKATASPSVPDEVNQQVSEQLAQEVAGFYAATGQMPDPAALRAAHAEMQERAEMRLREIARQIVERMERKMEDQLSEGGFNQAIAEFLSDFVTYPTAILKGPTLRRRSRLSWGQGEGGKIAPVVSEEIVPEFERVNPFRAYPAPGAASPQDGYFIEHVTLSYDELHDMIGSPGVNEEAVRGALDEADNNGLTHWFGTSDLADEPDTDEVSSHLKRKVFNIDAMLFYGPVRGQDLIDWGVEDPIDDPDKAYETCVWMVGRWVIKAHLNYDPLGVRPYFSASYNNVPGSFWGESVPDMLSDMAGDDGLMQVTARSLANNVALASGPMMGINTDRLQAGTDLSTIHPWMQILLANSEYGNNADRPLEFFQPQMHAQELLLVLKDCYQFADSFSMIPRSAAGDSPTGGVGRTASGFAIQMDAAGKGLKAGVLNVDAALSGLLSKLYAHNMQFDPDETLKGDAQVVARGATSLMQQESLRIRRNEALQATNNPTDLQIMGLTGRAEILRTTLDDLDIDVSRVIPPRDKLQSMQAAAQQPQLPPPGGEPGAQPAAPQASEEVLPSGHPTTDNFSPNAMTPNRGQGFAAGGPVFSSSDVNRIDEQAAARAQEISNSTDQDPNARFDDDVRRRWSNSPYKSVVGMLAAEASRKSDSLARDVAWAGGVKKGTAGDWLRREAKDALAAVNQAQSALTGAFGGQPNDGGSLGSSLQPTVPAAPALSKSTINDTLWDNGVTKRADALSRFRAGKITADQLAQEDKGLSAANSALRSATGQSTSLGSLSAPLSEDVYLPT